MSRARFVVAVLSTLALGVACSDWNQVRSAYCEHHPEQTDCQAGTGGGGQGGGMGGGAGGGTGGAPDANGLPYDGGVLPEVSWAVVLGGADDDEVNELALEPSGGRVALVGSFFGAAQLGPFVLANPSGSSAATVGFAAFADVADGGIVKAIGRVCAGAGPLEHLAFGDAGLVLTGRCAAGNARALLATGGVVTLDAGGPVFEDDLDWMRWGDGLEPYRTLGSRRYNGRLAGVAGTGGGAVYFAATSDAGFAALGTSGPDEAMAGTLDPSTGQATWGASFTCSPSGLRPSVDALAISPDTRLFGIYSYDPTRLPDGGFGGCDVKIPPDQSVGGFGSINPGRHLALVDLTAPVVNQAFGMSSMDLGLTREVGPPMRLAAGRGGKAFLAGPWQGSLWVGASGSSSELVSATPVVLVARVEIPNVQATWVLTPAAGAVLEVHAMAVDSSNLVSQTVWLTGRVVGSVLDGAGNVVLRSTDAEGDGFVLQLNASLSPQKRFVFGVPGIAEVGRGIAVVPGGVVVAARVGKTSTPGGSYAFHGASLALLGGSDVVLFRVPLP